jgi:hypothetical protein
MGSPIQRTDVDGVPVLWVDADVKPLAALLFRVGRADEPFVKAGATHVVEHLAFHQLGERPYQVNGFVDHVQTVFHAAGRADENAAFLTDVAGAVSNLETDRLPQELRVLRVEAGQRGPVVINALFTYRYGAETLGRAAVAENALHRITPDEVTAWSRDWFTRGSAVAWMSYPPPAGFRLPLPDGPRVPPGPRHPIWPLPLPSFGIAQLGGVALGGPILRTSPGAAGIRILRNRLERRLRRDLGLSYEISELYVPLDAEEAFVSLYASCRDDQAAKVAEEAIRLAEELAAGGPTPEELAEDVDAFVRNAEDPQAVLGELVRAASNELLGHPQDGLDQLRAELEAVTTADVAGAMEPFVARLIGLATQVPELTGRWKPYPMWSVRAVEGPGFDSVAKRYPWTKGTPVMRTSPEGLSLVHADGRAVTVHYAACAGVVRPADSVRILIGNDGFQLRVDAQEWKNGLALVAAIDKAVPPAAQVTLVP